MHLFQFRFSRLLPAVLLLLPGHTFAAQDIYVYPTQGQSSEQLGKDRYECHRWAVTETGYDPMRIADMEPPRVVRVPVPENRAQGATAAGAVTGAVAGGVIGAGSHHHGGGEGVVIGAVLGTIVGAAMEDKGEREARAQADAAAQQQADKLARNRAERSLLRANYHRALSACLEGRGYTVR